MAGRDTPSGDVNRNCDTDHGKRAFDEITNPLDAINLDDTRAVGYAHGDNVTESVMANVVDRFHEALYFYEQVLDNYHDPWKVRFNLNAYIQAFRSITFMLQAEKGKPVGFRDWYAQKQAEMAANDLLSSLNKSRRIIVHERVLIAESSADLGVFKYYRPKLYVQRKISPFAPTEDILEHAKPFEPFYEPGVFIGEQLGVARKWVVLEIGHGEIASYCRIALTYMNQLIDEIYHLFFNKCFPPHYVASPWPSRIYFETDANPELGEKWGWAPPPLGPLRRNPPDPEQQRLLKEELDQFIQRMANGEWWHR